MRIRLSDLAPGVNYALQIRVTDGTNYSEWSRRFDLLTTSDTVAPKTPTGLTTSMSGTTFVATWDAVTLSTDNTPAHDLDYYEVKVESSGTGTTGTYVVKEATKFQFTFDMNRQLFGTARAGITMSVRAVDITGNASAYSSTSTQTNPAPAAVTGLTVTGAVDSVNVSWNANTTDTDLVGYEVWVSKTGSGGTYSQIWSGAATSMVHSTIDYFTDHWYRVFSVDVFGTKSTATTSGAAVRPVGSFTIDTTAPAVPTGLAATITTLPNLSGASMAVSWTAVADPDNDLAGYRIGYRPVGASDWQYTDVDYTLTSTLIDKLTALVNYEVRIRAYDYSANFSAWSATVTTTTAATNTAPSTPAAPTAASSAMKIQVSHNNQKAAGGAMEADVVYYEVYVSSASGFTPASSNMVGTMAVGPAIIEDFYVPASNASGTTQTMYVKVIAVDSGGLKSAASAQATASPNLILTANIGDAQITNAKINDLAANKITAGTGLIADLTVKSTLTLGDASTDGIIKSYDWVASTTGYKMTKNTLEINSGTISAAALQLQNGHNMMPPEYADFEYGDYYYINPFWNPRGGGAIFISGGLADSGISADAYRGQRRLGCTNLGGTAAMFFYLGKTATDYNIPVEAGKKYIYSVYAKNFAANADDNWVMKVKADNGTTIASTNLNFSGGFSQTTWTRFQGVVTIPVGVSKVVIWFDNTDTTHSKDLHIDAMQFEPVVAGLQTASPWKPPGSTTIDASGIITGYLRSNQNVDVNGTTLPSWSLNKEGNIQVGDALVRGKLVVGSESDLVTDRVLNPNFDDTDISNFAGYQSGTGTLPALTVARTTTVGEVISSPASLKISSTVPVAPNGRIKMGSTITLAKPISGPADIIVEFSGMSDEPQASAANQWGWYIGLNGSSGVITTASIGVFESPSPNVAHQYSTTISISAGQTVTSVDIAKTAFASTTTDYLVATKVILDDIRIVSTLDNVGSYVSSHNFQQGSIGWRIDGAGNAEFNNGVFRGTLGANMVNAENMVSELVISSQFKTASTGRRVEFGGTGITMYESDETLLVNLPTDSTSPAMFNGDLLATSLTVSDQMAIRGSNNELAKGATLTVASGTTAPTSPPSVQVGWEQLQVNNDTGWKDYRYGLAYSSVDNAFMSVQNVYGANAAIIYWDKTTGVQYWTTTALKDIVAAYGGITVIGSEIFVLGQKTDTTWAVEVRNLTTKAWVRTMAISNSYNYRPGLGNNGTELTIIYAANADRRVWLTRHNATTGAQTSMNSSNVYLSGGNYNISSSGYIPSSTSGAFTANRYYYTRDNLKTVYVLDASLLSIAAGSAEDFVSPNNIRGMVFADAGEGNRFFTYDNASGKVTKHTTVNWAGSATSSNRWHVANTWYDSNATGGTHETDMGPVTSFTMTKRAGLTLTAPPLPIRPVPNTTDDAVAAGFYMARNSSTPTRLLMERQSYGADNARTIYINRNGGADANLPTAGVNATNPPPSSNGFASLTGSPGLVRSANDKFNMFGDGSGAWGDMTISSAGAISFTNSFTAASLRPVDSGIVGGAETNTTTTPAGYASGPAITVTAPASGIIVVHSLVFGKISVATAQMSADVYCRVGSAAGAVVGNQGTLATFNVDYVRAGGDTVWTGLTPGQAYYFYLAFRTNTGGTTATISQSRLIGYPQP